jgi:hypothetical protein
MNTSDTDRAPAVRPTPKAVDTGIVRMTFEMSDCHIHLWLGSTEQWEAGPGAEQLPEEGWPDWSVQHVDLDAGRVAAVKCVLKPDEEKKHAVPKGYECLPSAESVRKLRKIRTIILDALEQSDEVTSIEMIAGGDGRARWTLGVVHDVPPKDRRHILDPQPFATLSFSDDEDQQW